MKKLILLFILTIVPFTINAQSLEETKDYLNANILNYAYNKDAALKCENNYCDLVRETYLSGKTARFKRIYLNDIKSIAYVSIPEGIIISLIGKGIYYKVDSLGNLTIDEHISTVEIGLIPSTPIDKINNIIKAMKHLATLNGAILINDDLFKD